MKLFFRVNKGPRRGMALLMVLAVLVLISALVIGFLLSTTTELKSSKSYASGAATRHLADSAAQIVIAQIADATKGTSGSDLLSWASQPGMIRTYTQAGSPGKYYKLYSSDSLIKDGASFNLSDEMPPIDWDAQIGLYTDLNAPVLRDGKVHFPIVDPRAKSSTAGQSVEGFDYTADVNGVVLSGGSADAQRLPMPVRWLYVLENGKFVAPLSSANGTVTFNSADGPSDNNPIVGRIAFWTDDDTSKININTASEGTFWDRPWANNTTEQNFATSIPAQNEFQRYPGHPAKTSLSTVLGSLLPSPSPAWYGGINSTLQAQNQSQLKAYYDLVPRVADGGTRGGTVNETDNNGNPNGAFTEVRPDADRLYASVDEFVFSATRTANSASIDNSVLERSRFFLTAHNRAPELNLFGKPRMTLWPLQKNTAERNIKDRLIAFCSEIGGSPYYFQRYNTYSAGNPAASSSQSTTLDWTGVPRNQDLYKYLDELTQKNVPGFGGNFASKYPVTRKQILTEMFDQIRSGVNAYSTDLVPKYSYAPDYLQPGSGQVVPLVLESGAAGGTHGFGRFSTIVGASIVFYRSNAAYYTKDATGAVVTGSNVVTPQNPNGVVTTPAARIGATLILNPFTPSPGFPPWNPNLQYVVSGLDSFKINGAPMGFTSPLRNTVTARAEYSGGANSSPFFGVLGNFRYSGGAAGDISKTPGSDPVTQYPFTTTGIQLTGSNATTFDFGGASIIIKIYSGADTGLSSPIQTIHMTFPDVRGLPIPTTNPILATAANPAQNPAPTVSYFSRFNEGASSTVNLSKQWRLKMIQSYPVPTTKTGEWDFLKYYGTVPALGNDSAGNAVTYWVQDVARGVEADPNGPAKGDYRFYAALNTVPADYFKACEGYDEPVGGPQIYSNVQTLRDEGADSASGGFGFDSKHPGGYYKHYAFNAGGSENQKDFGNSQSFDRWQQIQTTFTTGVLIPKAALAPYAGVDGRGSNTGDREYRGSARPAVPPGLTAAMISNQDLGDWDNLTGLLADGPFINKPDEGNSATVSHTQNKTNIDVYYGTKDIAGGYFSMGAEYAVETGKTFSPNRQIASAVLFGSLPTGIDPGNGNAAQPWRTLLFSPTPLAKDQHPGRSSPPDHLFLDLFTMPIVEPYAISEPFSTAGKVNMNYQIMPFGYITRDTGVRAVLKASKIMAIPQSLSTVSTLGNSYKDGQRAKYEFRYDINPDRSAGTLAGFEQRFDSGDIFRSASEICDIYLVPKQMSALSSGMTGYPPGGNPPTSYSATKDWWDNFLLTGDNTREAPYGDIYARLTTKSNTYTIHYKVQSLKKVRSTAAGQWVEGRDQVTGEIRGSTTVERYIDLGNPDLANTDFALSSAPSAEGFYKIRTIGSSIFNP